MNKSMLEEAMLKYQQEKDEIRRIMLDKLKEMAEIAPDEYIDGSDYAAICSVMNDIAKTLLDE